ncbi:MAG: bifunctional adenosylcobinamide kinase/adenosylcobinamide-phosphate guanylyltransferase [Candidatus Brocadia sp.]|nr:bifunctional adenosylcobinamide kinase/adenosylcobinamide-phosphate guanylyltransferase [Candidatus Brocadia sp.]
MAKIIFVIGGARSGKSAFAEGFAKKYDDVVYIATAEAKDEEMRERIRIHCARRPFDWKTIESPYHVDKAVSDLNGKAGIVLIDCITLYITNMFLRIETGASGRGERPFAPTLAKGHESSPSLTSSDRGGEPNQMVNSADCSEMQKATPQERQQAILAEIHKLGRVCRESKSDVIIISNEVGLGIVPDNALSREFRDIAGYANQILADEADEVYFMVAGIARRIK